MIKSGDFVTQPESIFHVITQVGKSHPPSIIIKGKNKEGVFLRQSGHEASPNQHLPLVNMKDLEILAQAIESCRYPDIYIKQFITELDNWWIARGMQ